MNQITPLFVLLRFSNSIHLLPSWVIDALDQEAKKNGVTRQSIIKVWIAEKLKAEADHLHAN